jgi:uncharacterized membrane protein YgcG
LLLVLLAAPTTARGEEKRATWERIDVNITVHDDGSFTVEELLQVRFEAGTFTYGFRDIPKERLNYIDEVRVWDDEGEYSPLAVGGDRTFTVDETKRLTTITWHFPPMEDVSHTFHLSYRVHGGLRAYPDGDQLWWKAVFPDRQEPVAESTVIVHAPAAITLYKAYFAPASATLLDERTVQFQARKPIPPNTPFEVRVQWPHGLVAATPAPWQVQADEEAAIYAFRERWKPVVSLAVIFCSLAIAVLGLLFILLTWYFRGRDRNVERIEYLTAPPSDLPPALAGQLLDVFMQPRHVLGTILDLANRGMLEIEETSNNGDPDYRFRLTNGFPNNLTPFEQRTLRAFMGYSSSQKLKSIKKRFAKHVKPITQAQESALVERGLFPKPPTQLARPYARMSNLLIVAGIFSPFILMMALFIRLDISVSLTMWLTGSLLLVGFIMSNVKRFMIPRTPKGSQEAERWRAFRRYLAGIKEMTEAQPAHDIMARYLAYAVALGVEDAFLKNWQGDDAETLWTPTWYHASSPGIGGESMDLGDASRGMTAGLASMSAGLASMLAATSSALSSGSGSGGFSGGGGSGGGGGGGGGGGFG